MTHARARKPRVLTASQRRTTELQTRVDLMQSRLDALYAKVMHQRNPRLYVWHYMEWSKSNYFGQAYGFTTTLTDKGVFYIPKAVVFEHDVRRCIMVIGNQFVDKHRTNAFGMIDLVSCLKEASASPLLIPGETS